ncbi:AAA family ATPase [Arthrobacter woluwensis]|uniref:AAA family ATPase n=1 Tax=Arthrobacter woluwensis TaxID=156980 RepID=UPI00380637EA
MRAHILRLEAFGPFATLQELDFDAIAAQGLFLLEGPTGAGKTSILDAIAVALYGRAPGGRTDVSQLRSDHAAFDVAPWVELEFTAQARRMKVRRDLPWQRPSARARSGYVPVQAKATLEEYVDGTWQALSNRSDEVGQLIADRLGGMSLEQFTRVALLPQGEFANFLRAPAKERADLLGRLFGTDRFEKIEDAAARMSQTASEDVADKQRELDVLRTHAAREVPIAPVMNADDDPAQEDPESPEEALDFWGTIIAAAATAVTESETRAIAAQQQEDTAQRTLENLQAEAHRATTLQELTQRQERHQAGKDAQEERLRILARYTAAQALAGPLHTLASTETRHTHAQTAWETAAAPLAGLQGTYQPSTEDAGHSLAHELQTRSAELQTLANTLTVRLHDEQLLQQHHQDRQEAANQAHSLETELSDLHQQHTNDEHKHQELTHELQTLDDAPTALAKAEQALDDAEHAIELHSQLTQATQREATALETWHEARQRAQDAREHWQDAREQRLNGAAALLAADLQEGHPCRVCGSPDHPAPASTSITAVELESREQEAEGTYQQADEQARAAESDLATVREEIRQLAAQGATTDAAAVSTRLADARAAHEQQQQRTRRRTAVTRAMQDLQSTLHALQGRIRETEQLLTGARSRETTAAAQSASLAQAIDPLRGEFGTLAERHHAVSTELAAILYALERWNELARTTQDLAEAQEAFTTALTASALSSRGEVEDALLTSEDLEQLQSQIQAFVSEGHALAERAEDPETAVALREKQRRDEQGSGNAVEEQVQQARDELALAQRHSRSTMLELGLAKQAAQKVDDLHQQHETLLGDSLPLIERAERLERLSAALRGGRGDNAMRMSLTDYVLAARLEQVAAAASERLTAMSDGRYTLEHSDARERRGARSGLGLAVLDGWTGQRRAPESLSGGETFTASLALALGLADVVQEEAGGTTVDTLFVDEGFGSLDEESLGQVMDSLEALLDAGRVVGLVSHVPEMKTRIPSQIQVLKGRQGSNIRVVGEP